MPGPENIKADTTDPDDGASSLRAGGQDSAQPQGAGPARIVEEHHVTNARGEDDIEAVDDRGRRWYHLRPEPRYRADVMGVNYSWWLTAILLIVVFVPWGWWY